MNDFKYINIDWGSVNAQYSNSYCYNDSTNW